ncbi:hypothetical protein POMI540_3435 [Schizosaccharomyces pombe]
MKKFLSFKPAEDFLRSLKKSSQWFLLIIIVEVTITLSFEGYVFHHFRLITVEKIDVFINAMVPSTFALFCMACPYLLYTAVDALLNKDVIQMSALLIFHVSLFCLSVVQYFQIFSKDPRAIFLSALYLIDPIRLVTSFNYHERIVVNSHMLLFYLKPFVIALPVLIGVTCILLSFLVYKMNKAFGWIMYQQHGPDLRMRRRYLVYKIFMSLIKSDYYFCLTATVQYAIFFSTISRVGLALTILVFPCTIATLMTCRLYLGVDYGDIAVANIFVGFYCISNFGYGLREYLRYIHQKQKVNAAPAVPKVRMPLDD